MLRNFSALGFSCDNWQNETVTLTIMPVALHPADANADVLQIDDFAETAGLWPGPAAIVREASSPSGFALQLSCAANKTSCGAPDPKRGVCPPGCLLDTKEGWCQSVRTSFTNRRQSARFPLPTEEAGGSGARHGVIHVKEFQAFNLQWRPSDNYQPPPLGSTLFYPVGMPVKTTRPLSNRESAREH